MLNRIPVEIVFQIVKFLNVREDFFGKKYYLINKSQFYHMTKEKYFWKYFLNRLNVDTKSLVSKSTVKKFGKVPFSPKKHVSEGNLFRKLFKGIYVRKVIYFKYLRIIKMINEGGSMSSTGFKRISYSTGSVFSKIFSLYEKGFSKNKSMGGKFEKMRKNGKFFEYFWVKDIYHRVYKFYVNHGKNFFGSVNIKKNRKFIKFGKKFHYEVFYVLTSDYLSIKPKERKKYEKDFIKIFMFLNEIMPKKYIEMMFNLCLFDLLYKNCEFEAMKSVSRCFNSYTVLNLVKRSVAEENIEFFFEEVGVKYLEYFSYEGNIRYNFYLVFLYFLKKYEHDVKLIEESVSCVFSLGYRSFNGNRKSIIKKYGEYIDVTNMKFFGRIVRTYRYVKLYNRKADDETLKELFQLFFEELKMDKKLINKKMSFNFLGYNWSGKQTYGDEDYTMLNMRDDKGTFMHQFVSTRSQFVSQEQFSDAFEYLLKIGGDIFVKNGRGQTPMDIVFLDIYSIITPQVWGSRVNSVNMRRNSTNVQFLARLPEKFYKMRLNNGFSPLYNVVFKMFDIKRANNRNNHNRYSVYFILKEILKGGAVFSEDLNEREEKFYQLEIKRMNYISSRKKKPDIGSSSNFISSFFRKGKKEIYDDIDLPLDFLSENFSE